MFNFLGDWLTGGTKKKEWAAFTLVLGSAVSLLASLVLSIEALVLARGTEATLSCDINAVLSCSGVAQHWSAELLGFPNSFLGLATLPVMLTIGVILLARVNLPQWFMLAAQAGAVVGLVFAAWMLYMSIFEIRILCPWCLTTDVGMLLIFYGLTRYNILTGVVGGKKAKKIVQNGYDTFALVLVAALIVVAVLGQFGDQLF